MRLECFEAHPVKLKPDTVRSGAKQSEWVYAAQLSQISLKVNTINILGQNSSALFFIKKALGCKYLTGWCWFNWKLAHWENVDKLENHIRHTIERPYKRPQSLNKQITHFSLSRNEFWILSWLIFMLLGIKWLHLKINSYLPLT